MHYSTKRRIAIEFLLFLSGLLIPITVFSLIYAYEYIPYERIKTRYIHARDVWQPKRDSLYDLAGYDSILTERYAGTGKVYEAMEEESIYDSIVSLKIDTAIVNEYRRASHIYFDLDAPELNSHTLDYTAILLIILFPLRYLIMAIIWAIRTVRNKPD